MTHATLKSYLWISKRAVPELPSDVTADFEYRIKLLNTPEGKQQQQQIASINEMAGMGDLIADITDDDELLIKNWSETDKWWKFCRGDVKKIKRLAKRLGLSIKDERTDAPWGSEVDDLKLVMAPRDYQPESFHKWEKAGHGIFEADPGFGKAQPVDEVVLTPTGWRQIGSIKVGEQVIGSDGNPCQVTGVFPQGARPVCTMRFSDGANVRADIDHLWAVKNSSDDSRGKPWRVLTTQQVQDSLRESDGKARWKVPLVEVKGQEGSELPLDPYVVGVLIGGGCLADRLPSPIFTTVDEEIVQNVNARVPDGFRCVLTQDPEKNGRTPSYRISRATSSFKKRKSEVKEALKRLGLWGSLSYTKFIPDKYLSANAPQRRLLLAGLMDTDGWAKGSQFSTVSHRLALDVVQLVRSLGGTARLTEKKTSYIHRGQRKSGRISYMVTVKAAFTPFLLERKKQVYERRHRTRPCRKIVAVEDGGASECVCISVDAPDCLYVTRDYIVTHNTFIMCWRVTNLRQYTLVLAHTDALVEQFIERFRFGSGTAVTGYSPVTNCLELEEDKGIKIIGRYKAPKKGAEPEIWPVTVATWQSFTSSSGRKALNKLKDRFGLALIDEAHVFAAPGPASVVNAINAKTRHGVSVGPDSYVELRGGPFVDGWAGPIADAFDMMDGLQPTEMHGEHHIVRSEGVFGRGWTGKGFGWKPVKSFIRHAAPDESRWLTVNGERLMATNDHSIYVATDDGQCLAEVPACEVTSEDILILDDGAEWGSQDRNTGVSQENEVNDSLLADLISSQVHEDLPTKRIPGHCLVSWSRASRQRLLNVFRNSDGNESIDNKCFYRTASHGLARDVLCLLRGIGLVGTIHSTSPSGVMSYSVYWNDQEMTGDAGGKKGNKQAFNHDHVKYLEASIQKNEPVVETVDEVYDLEMGGHPSFVANGVLVHNTATPERKDQLDVALYDVIGPKTAKGSMKQLPLTATLIATGCKYQGSRFAQRSEFPKMVTYLTKQASRNDLIFKWIKHDIDHERHVLLLCDRRQWVLDMVERLNAVDIEARAVLGGMGSKKGIAERNKTIGLMMGGKICVIAATQVFKLGIDIPVLDTVHVIGPMSNKPLLKQISGRIRRFYDGKQEPVLRYYCDEGSGLLYGCAKGTHKHLVELGADISLVPVGRSPSSVVFGDGYKSAVAKGSMARKKKRSLKSAVLKSPQGTDKLFNDLQAEAWETGRYKKRMGG